MCRQPFFSICGIILVFYCKQTIFKNPKYYLLIRTINILLSMKLMLIDDDNSIMESIQSIMESLGHECEVYQNPCEALAAYGNAHFDVVVTDYKMPGMDGVEVLKRIRAIDSDAYVILLTGYPDLVDTISALNYGVYAFLSKPVRFDSFISMLLRIENEKEKN